MKIIIAGGRTFNNYPKMTETVNKIIESLKLDLSSIEIVSGTAQGADKLGEKYAHDHQLSLKKFPANWDLHGKIAGYKRNVQMAEYADMLIAFWDCSSTGTFHMINVSRELKLIVHVITY